jgi:hypothetical protein
MDDSNPTSRRAPAGADEDGAPDAAQAAELSRAAREAVRQPADPRIDRQLAWMGLATDDKGDAPAAGGAERPSLALVQDSSDADEVNELRTTLARVGASLDQAHGRIRILSAVVAVEAIALVTLAMLSLAR